MIRFTRKQNNVTTFIVINTDYITSVICSAPDRINGVPQLSLYLMGEKYPYGFLGNEAYQVLDALKPYLEKVVEFHE